MVELDRTPHIGEYTGICRVRYFGGLIEQTEHTLRCGARRLQLGENIRHFIDGAGEAAAVLDKRRYIAQRYTSEHVQHRAEHGYERQ